MVRIAFCDDDFAVLNEIQGLLDRYRAQNNREVSYRAFHSPLDLLAEIEGGTRFDVLLLDVLMPGENGINTAAEIRSVDENVKIIFLSSSAEYAVQSYSVDAFYYLLKPIREEPFFGLMDKVLSLCVREQRSSIILRCKNGITSLDPQHLEYCEVIHRTLFIYLTDGRVLESNGSLDELSGSLMSYGNFLRPHRSFLVNLDYVESLSYRAITMACQTQIPIPRGKFNEIKNMFLEYAFDSRQVTV